MDGLDLENAGVEFSANDGIAVDAQLRTTAATIWAVGDVTNVYPFTHVADYQARIAEHNALSGNAPLVADYSAIPWATFTDPELSRVGMTEEEARAAGHDVVAATVQMKDLARAITSGETAGMVKLVVDRSTGQILGGHILAANGGETDRGGRPGDADRIGGARDREDGPCLSDDVGSGFLDCLRAVEAAGAIVHRGERSSGPGRGRP